VKFDSETVSLTSASGVAVITLNRPHVLNVLNLELTADLVRAVETCAGDTEVRCLVVTGAGRAFCAGGDIRPAYELLGGRPSAYFADLTKYLHRLVADLRLVPKPVVAAINGAAAGAGMSLALACDLRVISQDAFLKQAYTSIGLCPDGGWSAFAPALAGAGRASEILLLDERIPADQALAWGLVNLVVPADLILQEALGLARRLTTGAATSYAAAKELLNHSLWPNLEAHLERERQSLLRCAETPDFARGATALIGKSASAAPPRTGPN